MDYVSEELKNATIVKSSITDDRFSNNLDLKKIKEDLRFYLTAKDRNLSSLYDICNMTKCDTSSGNDVLRKILIILRDHYSSKFRQDNNKNLTIRKNFDIMLLCLDNLNINESDCKSDEMFTVLLSFLSKNFL
jgi:hypothetical protein